MDNLVGVAASERNTLQIINYVFAGLSMIASLAISFVFYRSWSQWTYSGKMIICLSLSNFVYAVTNFLPLLGSNLNFFCDLDGFLRTFSILSCFLWATRIAYHAYIATSNVNYNPNKPVNLLKGFLPPLLIAIIPLFNQHFLRYDYLDLNCDINSSSSTLTLVWICTLLLGPMTLSIALTFFFYAKVIENLRGYEEALGIRTRKFLSFPFGLVVSWTPTIIFKVVYICGYHGVWLEAINIVFSRSSGLINAFIYGWHNLKSSINQEEEAEENHLLPSNTVDPTTLREIKKEGRTRRIKTLAF